MVRKLLLVVALAALVAGCNGGYPLPPPFDPRSVTPQRLYVGNTNQSGEVFAFALPITASSTPVFTITSPDVFALALDPAGNLATAANGGPNRIFPAPLSGSSTPSATFANGAAISSLGIAFVPSGPNAGDLWTGSIMSQAYRFTPPFSNGSTPATTLTPPGATAVTGIAFDSALTMYVTNAPGASSNIIAYVPPYTGLPVVTPSVTASYRKDVAGAKQLFVAAPLPAPGRIDVYTLPLTAVSVPAFAITTGAATPEAVALDSAGNLYVGNLNNHTVTVYAPPFSAASAPAVTLTVGSASTIIFAIAVGT